MNPNLRLMFRSFGWLFLLWAGPGPKTNPNLSDQQIPSQEPSLVVISGGATNPDWNRLMCERLNKNAKAAATLTVRWRIPSCMGGQEMKNATGEVVRGANWQEAGNTGWLLCVHKVPFVDTCYTGVSTFLPEEDYCYDPVTRCWLARGPAGESEANLRELAKRDVFFGSSQSIHAEYSSLDAAALAAGDAARDMGRQWDARHQEDVKKSKNAARYGMEHCGKLYQNGGRYIFTGPFQGMTPSEIDAVNERNPNFRVDGCCNPNKVSETQGPAGWSLVAAYHSHPDEQSFSDADKAWAHRNQRIFYVTRGSKFPGSGNYVTEKYLPPPPEQRFDNGQFSTIGVTAR